MPHVLFSWNDELVEYIAQHGVTPDEFEHNHLDNTCGPIEAFSATDQVAAPNMSNKKPTSERVYRDLTSEEQKKLEVARTETEAARENILAAGRLRKKAWLATQREVRRTVDALRTERERLGLSLADVEARSGLKRSALSRLENDPNANPTLLTLQRYAAALCMTLSTSVESVS